MKSAKLTKILFLALLATSACLTEVVGAETESLNNGEPVITTTQEGDGKTFPTKGQTVEAHYRGYFPGQEENEFDSSYKRNQPFSFKIGVGQVIRCWDYAIAKLSVGQKATVLCPSDWAYGERGAGSIIPGNQDLMFDIELLGTTSTTEEEQKNSNKEKKTNQSIKEQQEMIKKIFKTRWRGEGVGANVRRAIGVSELQDLDPFLMLDMFNVKLPAGFPDHPHRGFETVTYMISGKFYHEDFGKNSGEIGPGDVQWMTAGKGIVHAEMPASKTENSIGFQLWINLPQEKKLIDPKYQEFKAAQLPFYEDEEMKVIVISGSYKGIDGKITPESTAHFYDVHLKAGKTFRLEIPDGWNGLVYSYEASGRVRVNQRALEVDQVAVFKGRASGSVLELKNESNGFLKFIVVLGKPLEEPVAKYGPFVMSTREELYEAFEDYQEAKNGFENSTSWSSKIRKLGQGGY